MMESVDIRAEDRIIEPFVGGGALFFAIRPKSALLGDVNADLIACYTAIRDSPAAVSHELAELTINRVTYTQLASARPLTDVGKAVRLIYLNRTAFGGIWRVNQMGEFNVPFGCKPETRLPQSSVIARASELLQSASLYTGDFAVGLASAADSDVIYCDPPYTVAHNNNGFVRYNERIFSWADQQRLASSAQSLASNGRALLISNAAHCEVVKLYPRKLFIRVIVHRRSSLAASPQYRGDRREALIVSKTLISSSKRLQESLSRRGLNVEVA
jgi:DNA adenine methylase